MNTPLGASKSLPALVAALPEIYQPIFGHPEFSAAASRGCEDRLAHITHIYRLLEGKLGRPLRVVDLGCAQGFFSFHLAKLGAAVFGVDFQQPNIDVCQALAAEHPELKVIFMTGMIEDVVRQMGDGQCDLVLGLSVFHHITHKHGVGVTQQLLKHLAHKTSAGIYEMALAEERLYWAAAQPENPRDLFIGYSFAHEITRHVTHLGDNARPFYVASNLYWFLDGQAGKFDAWKTESHIFANGSSLGMRRYYFGEDKVIKLFDLTLPQRRQPNLRTMRQEAAFLQNPPRHFKAPRLLLHGEHAHEIWLARDYVPGELLVDAMRDGKSYDAKAVLLDVLEQLALLQDNGLYHDDVRLWNVLMTPEGRAELIDYGAISEAAKDCLWPHNIFLSFLIFMQEILTGRVAPSSPVRAPLMNPELLPEPYRSIAWELLEQAPDHWRFSFLRERIAEGRVSAKASGMPSRAAVALLVNAYDEACGYYRDACVNYREALQRKDNPAPKIEAESAKVNPVQLTQFWN